MVKILLAVVAFVAVVDVVALPEKLVAVRVDVDGLYVTPVFVNTLVVPAPVANSNGKFVFTLDVVITILVAFVAVVEVVALPEKVVSKS